MRHMIAALAVIPLIFVMHATPGAQTREKPLRAGRGQAKPVKWTKFVPPAVTARDLDGPSALVILELLVDPAGKVEEVTVRKAPANIVDAVKAAAKQWIYTPMIVDGKGVWFLVTSSIQIRPMDGGAGLPVNDAPPSPAPAEMVHVSTGVSRDGSGPVTLVTREGQGNLREAFLIAHQAGSRQAISFNGTARVLAGPDNELAVLPATGPGWVFLPQKATWRGTEISPPPKEVRITSVTKVPLDNGRSHQQLETTLMRQR